jgi:hypothetical protein
VGWKYKGKTVVGFILTLGDAQALVRHEASARADLVSYDDLFPLYEV